MALKGDTGNGWTFTAGTQTLSLLITKIICGEWSINPLEVSTLATTAFMEFVASDLKDGGEVTIEAMYEASATAPQIGVTAETFTITAALQTGNVAAATLAGTGFGTKIKWPDAANGEILKVSYTFKWDGDTGPTYTKATLI